MVVVRLAVWLVLCWTAVVQAQPGPPVVLVLGDSLSAEYGLQRGAGWVGMLADRIKSSSPQWNGPQYSVVNASISGETTSGGRSRLPALLAQHRPAVVIIELGANDGLRGLPLEQTRANLERMITAAGEAGARVLLIGMRLPPNYGPQYTEGFERNYVELAQAHGTALLPFLLEPIAMEREAFQADNLHPVAEAQPRLLEHVWPALEPLLDTDKRSTP